MKSIDEYVTAYRDTVQREVHDEPVLAVGVLSRPGSMTNTLLLQVSGLAALLKNRSAKHASGDLPQNVVAAVTPTRVLFFAFKPKMSSIVLKGLVHSVPRHGMHVGLDTATMATRLTFRLHDGSTFQLDSNRNIGQYQRLNEQLLAELGAVAAVS